MLKRYKRQIDSKIKFLKDFWYLATDLDNLKIWLPLFVYTISACIFSFTNYLIIVPEYTSTPMKETLLFFIPFILEWSSAIAFIYYSYKKTNRFISIKLFLLLFLVTSFLILTTAVNATVENFNLYDPRYGGTIVINNQLHRVSNLQITKLVFSEFSHYVFLISLFFYLPKFKYKDYFFKLFGLLLIGIAIVGFVGMFIIDWNDMILSFKDPNFYWQGARSIFGHKNTFGFLLMAAIFAVSYLNNRRDHLGYYCLMFFFAVLMVLTKSKTCLVLEIIYLPLYLIYRAVVNYKLKNQKTFIALTLLIGFGMLGGLALIVVPNKFLDKIISALQDNEMFGTISSRQTLWSYCLSMVDVNNHPFQFFFGYSPAGFRPVYHQLLLFQNPGDPRNTAHNGVLEFLVQYGFIGSIVSASAIVAVVNNYVQIWNHKKYSFIIFNVSVWIMFMINVAIESRFYFIQDFPSYTILFFTLLYPYCVRKDLEAEPYNLRIQHNTQLYFGIIKEY